MSPIERISVVVSILSELCFEPYFLIYLMAVITIAALANHPPADSVWAAVHVGVIKFRKSLWMGFKSVRATTECPRPYALCHTAECWRQQVSSKWHALMYWSSVSIWSVIHHLRIFEHFIDVTIARVNCHCIRKYIVDIIRNEYIRTLPLEMYWRMWCNIEVSSVGS